jgi:hypothetical protein
MVSRLAGGQLILNESTGLATGTVLTQSRTDTTIGKIMKVGDHGIGAALPEITDLTAQLAPGKYVCVGSTTTGSPTADAWVLTVEVSRNGVDGHTFIAVQHGNTALTQRAWFGTRLTATGAILWSEARMLVEAGSVTNGFYEKYSDGVMQCRLTFSVTQAISTAFLGGFRDAGSTLAFGVTFTAAPVVTAVSTSLTAAGCVVASIGTTACSLFFTAFASQSSAALTAAASVFGRWRA